MNAYLFLGFLSSLQFPFFKGQLLGDSANEVGGLFKMFLGEKSFNVFGQDRALPEISIAKFKQVLNSVAVEMKADNGSSLCLNSLQSTFNGVLNEEVWALKMLDSSSKIGNEITEGNIFWTGNYDLCMNINEPNQMEFKTNFCWIEWKNPLMDILNFNTSLCMPDTCTSDHLKKIMRQFQVFFPEGPNNLRPLNIQCLPSVASNWKQPFFVISMAIIVILVCLVIVGTSVEYSDVRKKEEIERKLLITCLSKDNKESVFQEVHSTSKNSNKDTEESPFKRFITCFSAYSNSKDVFQMNYSDSSLACLHGLRTFSFAYVILGHSMSFLMLQQDNMLFIAYHLRDFYFQFLMSGIFSVDTFFVLSGFLAVYNYMKVKEYPWPRFYLNRFLRITPVYWFTLIVLNMGLYLNSVSGSINWYLKQFQLDLCKNGLVKNVAYLQNFFNDNALNDCLGHTWYLANDMQFYWIAPLFLIFMTRKKWAGIASLVTVFLASCITSFYLLYKMDLSNLDSRNIKTMKDLLFVNLEIMDTVYIKPYCRIGAFVVGMACGWFLYKKNFQIKLTKLQAGLLWIVSFIICYVTMFYPYFGDYSKTKLTFYYALYHNTWSIAIAILIILCTCGYGGPVNTLLSWPGFQPISQLSFSGYLLHGVLFQEMYINTDESYHLSYSTLFLYFIGNFQLCLVAAYFLFLIVEGPAMKLVQKYVKKY